MLMIFQLMESKIMMKTMKIKIDNLFVVSEDIKANSKIGLFVSPNQQMHEVNKAQEYLEQFGIVILVNKKYLPKDLSALILPSINSLQRPQSYIDADFLDFLNVLTDPFKEYDFPIVGFGESCLSLWDILGNPYQSVTGHYKAGYGTKTMHLLNISRVPLLDEVFPKISLFEEYAIKVYSPSMHLYAPVQAKALGNNIHIIANANGSIEAFCKLKEVETDYVFTSSKGVRYAKKKTLEYVGFMWEPWLKTNFVNSFDHQVGGLVIGDHLSNLILSTIITNKK